MFDMRRTTEPALSDVAVDASRVTGVAQVRQPEQWESNHVHRNIVPWEWKTQTHIRKEMFCLASTDGDFYTVALLFHELLAEIHVD